MVLTAVQTNPDLLNVDRRSLWNACMRAAQDGLLPDGRLGALVVYKDKRRGPIAQWLPMIAGIRQKVRNSGEVATWEVHTVHEEPVRFRARRRSAYRAPAGARRSRPDHCRLFGRGAEIGRAIARSDVGRRNRTGPPGVESWRRRTLDGPGMAKCAKTVAKRHAKVLPMSSDLDDLLRRDDEDAPAIGGEPGRPPRTLTDALNMVASLPPQAAMVYRR